MEFFNYDESQIDILLKKAEKYKEARNLLQWICASQEIELKFTYEHRIPGVINNKPLIERKSILIDDEMRRSIAAELSKRLEEGKKEFDKYCKEVYKHENS